jgi:hypothetical protein
MEIRFVSTLTPEDEEQIAPAILTAITALLDQTGISYTLRLATSSEKVFQHNHPATAASNGTAARRLTDALILRSIPTTES